MIFSTAFFVAIVLAAIVLAAAAAVVLPLMFYRDAKRKELW